jgi:hypothetical protein
MSEPSILDINGTKSWPSREGGSEESGGRAPIMVACDLQDVGKLCGTSRERAPAIWREFEKQRRREGETARELLGMGWRGRFISCGKV